MLYSSSVNVFPCGKPTTLLNFPANVFDRHFFFFASSTFYIEILFGYKIASKYVFRSEIPFSSRINVHPLQPLHPFHPFHPSYIQSKIFSTRDDCYYYYYYMTTILVLFCSVLFCFPSLSLVGNVLVAVVIIIDSFITFSMMKKLKRIVYVLQGACWIYVNA